jgi:hypothetical protein
MQISSDTLPPTHPLRVVCVRFQVLAAGSMKMAVLWDVEPCSLLEVYWHFRGACYLHHQALSASTSETSVDFYQTTQHNNLEDNHLHTLFHENHRSYM